MTNCDICGKTVDSQGSFIELVQEVDGDDVERIAGIHPGYDKKMVHETYWVCTDCKAKYGLPQG